MQKKSKILYVEVNDQGICKLNDKKFSSVVLVANTKKTAVRIAESFDVERIEEVFPIGEKMNKDTHAFDSVEFVNYDTNTTRYMCAALPVDFTDTIAREAVDTFRGVHTLIRLDTVENILFRHYADFTSEPMWILLPQSDGLRVLHTAWSLPRGAYTISSHPDLRREELERAWMDSQKEGFAPERVVLLDTEDGVGYGWTLRFFAKKNAVLEVELFDLDKFVSKY